MFKMTHLTINNINYNQQQLKLNKKERKNIINTCFSRSSLLGLKHVTKYFVRLRNEVSTSNVR